MYVLRTMTQSAAMGFISARDFVDVVVNINNDEFVGTLGKLYKHTRFPVFIQHWCSFNSLPNLYYLLLHLDVIKRYHLYT